MHATRADLVGKDMTTVTGPDGRHVFKEGSEQTHREGEAFVHLQFPKPGTNKLAPKSNYMRLYKPWDWTIVTGVFTDDIDAVFDAAECSARRGSERGGRCAEDADRTVVGGDRGVQVAGAALKRRVALSTRARAVTARALATRCVSHAKPIPARLNNWRLRSDRFFMRNCLPALR
jgi:hypothetical protein